MDETFCSSMISARLGWFTLWLTPAVSFSYSIVLIARRRYYYLSVLKSTVCCFTNPSLIKSSYLRSIGESSYRYGSKITGSSIF